MTASIVARDPATGELGVAVFTAYPGVGMHVPFAQPGVGAVATQSFVEVSFGPRGLEMLREGAGAGEVVERLIASDPKPTVRQLGVLAADGDAAGFTGDACVPYVGEATAADCRCQANMMASEGVPETMAEAFQAAEGELAVRLLAALEAGEAALDLAEQRAAAGDGGGRWRRARKRSACRRRIHSSSSGSGWAPPAPTSTSASTSFAGPWSFSRHSPISWPGSPMTSHHRSQRCRPRLLARRAS